MTVEGQTSLPRARAGRGGWLRSPRVRRAFLAIGALAAIQGAMMLVYCQVTARRDAPSRGPHFPVERIERGDAAAALRLERADGSAWRLEDLRGRPVVLHFWATWCRPCRDELPTLLTQMSRIRGVGAAVVLVSVDDGWPAIHAFFAGAPPAEVSRAPSDDYQRLTVGILPETIILDARGVAVARVRGARDWRARSASSFLDSLERFR